jgi:immunity protein 8 of polymorphic toxin system
MPTASPSQLRAKLLSLRSPELDIDSEYPSDPECFLLLLEAEIGADQLPGGEVFRFNVCTPQWLSTRLVEGGEVWGQGLLVVSDWNVEQIRLAVVAMCSRTTGTTWQEVAQKLSRFTEWEFEGRTAVG